MAILFYDGVCGLCDQMVQFVLTRDAGAVFRFAPLQGPTAAELLPPRGADPSKLDTVYVLTDDDRLLRRSRAILYACGRLGWPWKGLRAFGLLPTFLTDLGYKAVAALRYRLFGKFDACRMPAPAEKARFLP